MKEPVMMEEGCLQDDHNSVVMYVEAFYFISCLRFKQKIHEAGFNEKRILSRKSLDSGHLTVPEGP